MVIDGYAAVKLTAPKSACQNGHWRRRSLKFPERTEVRQVAFFNDKTVKPETYTQALKRKIDSVRGKAVYHRRIATVEPVFGCGRDLPDKNSLQHERATTNRTARQKTLPTMLAFMATESL